MKHSSVETLGLRDWTCLAFDDEHNGSGDGGGGECCSAPGESF